MDDKIEEMVKKIDIECDKNPIKEAGQAGDEEAKVEQPAPGGFGPIKFKNYAEKFFQPSIFKKASVHKKENYFLGFEEAENDEKIEYICTEKNTEVARQFINEYIEKRGEANVGDLVKDIKSKIDDPEYECPAGWGSEDD